MTEPSRWRYLLALSSVTEPNSYVFAMRTILLSDLNGRVSGAIYLAEREGTAEAWVAVSELEESIANIVPADHEEGSIARVGAMTAAIQARDWTRALVLAERFNAEAGVSQDLRERMAELAEEAGKRLSLDPLGMYMRLMRNLKGLRDAARGGVTPP